MLFFNKSKVLFICLFTMVMGSHVAYGNIEFSGHFGKKFGGKIGASIGNVSGDTQYKNQPWHLGVDTFYRFSMETSSLGFGLRYRVGFQGENSNHIPGETDIDDIPDITEKYKFTTHRIALLVNYRVHIGQLFGGPILGLDIWKSFKLMEEDHFDGNVTKDEEKSNQFLWNQLTGQLGLEFGFMPTSKFLFKLEAGYDLLSFNDFEKQPDDDKMNLNGFYITLGVGVFFG